MDTPLTPPSVDVSIIIVNWNSKAFLRQCLTSLSVYRSHLAFEVIVVDGGSFDGCGEMLAREFAGVIFIQSIRNIGFARANNLGFRRSHGRNLLFLNPDTELIENAIDIICARLDSLPDAGAVGCRLLNSDRSLQTSCIQAFPTVLNQALDSEYLRKRFPCWRLWGTAGFAADTEQPQVVEVISGACLLVKRSAFERVGGFTETYFMYGEDLDLCFKLHRAGYRTYYVPGTTVVHHGGGSTQQAKNGFSNIMMRESVYQFKRTHHGWGSAVLYRLAMAITSVVRLLFIVPLLLAGDTLVKHGAGSLKKWWSILRWCLGLESWVCRPE
jgi:GT2 family glycosyltransferase